MGLRAVVFDYGMVLSGPPEIEAKNTLHRLSGLSPELFDQYYWVDRHAYDRGELSGISFWQKLAADAGLSLSSEQITELNHWDARMWTTANPEMLAWHRLLKEKGLIAYSRGPIQILDVEGLKAASCECYQIIKDHLDSYAEFDHAAAD